jgi:16S rRNA (guanine527-N7)-methyltransferase
MFIGYDHWENMIRREAVPFDLTLTGQQIRLLYQHAETLYQWNQKTNLTTISNPREIAIKHFIDCLAPAPAIAPMQHVLDVGSGGGFPGLPLKVWCPSINLTLIDAVRKKTSFLQYVVRTLKLEDTRTIHGRIEDLSASDASMTYDTIVCRAFGRLSQIIAKTLPLLSKHGKIVAWKGRMPHQEIQEAGFFLENQKMPLALTLQSYRLPIFDAERTLVIITPKKNRSDGKEITT